MGILSGLARALNPKPRRRRHPSAKRAANVRKYGLTPRQEALKSERTKRAKAAETLFYERAEARYNRMANAGFTSGRKKSKRHTERKLRQYTSVRGVMRQGYNRG